MICVVDEVHVDHLTEFEVVTSDEFDDVGEEVGYVASFGHTGEEPFHAVDEGRR